MMAPFLSSNPQRSPARRFSRRDFLRQSSLLAATLSTPAWLRAAPGRVNTEAAAEQVVAELWRRFISPANGTVLTFAGLDGRVILPTAEDCAAARPNGMSWCTPISDGGLYGGFLLDGLCLRWRAQPTAVAAAQARQIARGLVALGRAGKTPGFVARGFAADGRSFYPASSEDQVMPWFYGLWRYVRSGLPAEAERREIITLLEDTVLAVEGHGWQVPCDPSSFGFRGNYVGARHKDATRLLFLNLALHELTGRERWLESYGRLAEERIGPEQRTRVEWCATGMVFVNSAAEVIVATETASVSRSLWTSSLAQAALRGLWEMEKDPSRRATYARGLTANAQAAGPHLARHRLHAAGGPPDFEVDWRFLNATWRPQANCDEAIVLSRSQLPLWEKRNPRGHWEDDTMREPLFAAWIIALAADAAVRREHEAEMAAMLNVYRWDRLYTGGFLIALCVQQQLAVE